MKKLAQQFKLFKLRPHTVLVMLMLLFFLGNAVSLTMTTAALEKTAEGRAIPFTGEQVGGNNVCDIYMRDFAAKLMVDFNQFIDTNFKNKSSTPSLLQTGIAKYRELRAQLMTAYSKYHPNLGSAQLTTTVQPGLCISIIQKTLDDAKILLKQHAISTSGVKKSSALLQKYQQINAELANLYQQFVYMKAYLDSFSKKIPCYPKTACIKG